MQEYNASTHLKEVVYDAEQQYVLPGIIDIHTDALEAEIIPRPGADMPIKVAFRELERKMNGCGFTTVFHSLHLGYKTAEYGSKSKYSRQHVYDTIFKLLNGDTLINNKIHLRFEITGVDAFEQCLNFINQGYVHLLSLMDHTPGQGQYTKEVFLETTIKNGKTAELALMEYEEKISRPNIKGEKMEQLIQLALNKGIPIASHDDDTVEKSMR